MWCVDSTKARPSLTWPSRLLSWTSPPTKFLPRMQERRSGASKIGIPSLHGRASYISSSASSSVMKTPNSLTDPLGKNILVKHACWSHSLKGTATLFWRCHRFTLSPGIARLQRTIYCTSDDVFTRKHVPFIRASLGVKNPFDGWRITRRVMSTNIPSQVRWYFAHRP